ncbi:hypothetical protein [Scatolibacter rhodanostii]|uniref:hypothetical protein n=1 Tax=Scatolibacter rhodanostii TaxID=2014781 RepID=UPI000C08C3FA|nr:hypothetical protein [Scatolibacter rhodanostii]
MSLFRRKKKLFGNYIEPSCDYCSHNAGKKENIHCSLQLVFSDKGCKKFEYNPLKRIPKVQPVLKKDGYTADDFSL